MSAVAQPATVDQLALSLAPHQVLVHHDFSQQPNFRLSAPNALLVPEPLRTGWGEFSFVEGIFHALRHALLHLEFDYLQLLSPSCLPIKPVAEFEQHVATGAQAHFEGLVVMQDIDALMSVGWRAFTQQGSWLQRLARRLPDLYYGHSPGRRDEAGIWLRSGQGFQPLADFSRSMMRALSRLALERQPAVENLRYGSTWFGARRSVVQGMLDAFAQPSWHDYFSQLSLAEEFLIPSLLAQLTQDSAPTQKASLNHLIKPFNQAHPGWFELEDFTQLQAAPAFFARKFRDDPQASVRLRVLRELAGCPALAARAEEPASSSFDSAVPPTISLPPVPLSSPVFPSVKPAPVLASQGDSPAAGLAA